MTIVEVTAGQRVSSQMHLAIESGGKADRIVFLALGFHETFRIASHAYQMVLKSCRTESSKTRCERSAIPSPLQASVYVRHSFLVEHIIEISLFAAFPPKARFFDIVVFSPFPCAAELLFQISLLMLVEESYRSWIHSVPPTWMMKQNSLQEEDAASLLAAEYMIPKAALPSVVFALKVLEATAMPVQALHLVAIVV